MKIVNELADHGSTNDQRATSSNDQTFPRSLVEGRKRPVLIFPVEISRRKDKRRERKCADANTITSASEKECSNWPGAVRFDKNALRSETTSGTNISSLSSSVQSVQKVDDTKVDGSRSEEKELSGPVARLQDARWGKSSRENERRKRERRKGERRADKGERVEGESRRENKSRVWNKNVRTAVGSRRVTDPTASDKGRAGRNDEDGDRRKKRKIGRSKIRNWERALLQGRRVPSERYRERPGGGGGRESSEMKQQRRRSTSRTGGKDGPTFTYVRLFVCVHPRSSFSRVLNLRQRGSSQQHQQLRLESNLISWHAVHLVVYSLPLSGHLLLPLSLPPSLFLSSSSTLFSSPFAFAGSSPLWTCVSARVSVCVYVYVYVHMYIRTYICISRR